MDGRQRLYRIHCAPNGFIRAERVFHFSADPNDLEIRGRIADRHPDLFCACEVDSQDSFSEESLGLGFLIYRVWTIFDCQQALVIPSITTTRIRQSTQDIEYPK